ncbi:LptA/OstA family protein [Thermodesulfobacteriota bacterium]
MTRVMACLATLILVATFMTAGVSAQDVSSSLAMDLDQPVNIESIKFKDQKAPGGRKATLSGKVRVEQKDYVLTCHRCEIFYSPNRRKPNGANDKKASKQDLRFSNIRSIICSGNVRMKRGEISAKSDKAVFDNVKKTVTLTGRAPYLSRAGSKAKCEEIVYYIVDDSYELTRCKASIKPNELKKEEK